MTQCKQFRTKPILVFSEKSKLRHSSTYNRELLGHTKCTYNGDTIPKRTDAVSSKMNGETSSSSQIILEDSDVSSGDEYDSDTETIDTVTDNDTVNSGFNNFENDPDLENYNKLTNEQKQAYHQIRNLFENKKGKIVAINARSGTGKTFLLTTLAQNYNGVKFLTFRRDEASAMSLKLGDFGESYTYMSFYTNCLRLKYVYAVQLFNTNEKDPVDLLYKLILHARNYNGTDTKLIIVDSCTIPSASMLLLLYIISLARDTHIIFAGDEIQFSPIYKSSLHNGRNFDLIEKISDKTIRRLTDVRPSDSKLKKKLSQFRQMIQQNRLKSEVPFYFDLRYSLYRLFRTKYFTEKRFDTLFMAQFHQIITDRQISFIKYLRENSEIPHFNAEFYTDLGPIRKGHQSTGTGKFNPILGLAEGYKYVYIDTKGVNAVVLLTKIIFGGGFTDAAVVVRFLNDNHEFTLTRCKLNFYQILPAYRDWLTKSIESKNVYQFPLRPYTLTYHAALGRNIAREKLELSADCSYANAIYVGLCCICSYEDIIKIHAEKDLPSFVVTDYMRKVREDDTNYYRCPTDLSDSDRAEIMKYAYEKGQNNFIDSIQWEVVNTVKKFETKKLKSYTCAPRVLYEKPLKELQNTDDTPLMKIIDFVKNKFDVIENTMKTAPFDDIDKFKKKGTGYRQSAAYISLKREYEFWCKSEE